MALHTYNPTTWNTGDPITQNRMQNIEEGIDNAYRDISTVNSTVSGLNTTVSALQIDVGGAQSDVDALQRDVAAIGTYGKEGHAAWDQVSAVVDIASGTPEQGNLIYTKSLKQVIDNIDAKASSTASEVTAARKGKTNLVTKIDDIESTISGLSGGITSINDKFASASNSSIYGNFGSVDARLEADETYIKALQIEVVDTHESTVFNRTDSTTPYTSLDARLEDGEGRIVALQTEIANAHESTALNKTGANAYGSIDARFEAIEEELTGTNSISSRIDTLAGDVSDLSTNKINISAIANNLTTDTAGKVLDARQGKALNDAKVNIADIVDDVTHTDTDKPLSANQGKVLKDAIDTINSGLNTAETGLVARVSALETEVDMTSASSRIDSALSRLDAIDDSSTGAIKDINDKIDTIAGELGMTDTNGLKTLGTRVDELETNIETVATELGMVQSGEIVNTNTRIDILDATINDASTGLAATKAIADAAATASDLTALAGRVTTLEGKDTIIVDIPASGSNYTEGVPNINNPSENADYLIADDEGKYFYWRYFGAVIGWQLVGGAGGSGNGSSSGEFVASLEAITAPDANVDYFVGNSTNGYIHYRYIPPETEQNEGIFVSILPKGILANASVNANGKPIITTLENSNVNVLNNFNALKTVNCTTTYDTDGVTPKSYALSFTDINGQEYTWDLAAGGGGSSYTVQFINESGNLELYVPNNATSASIAARIYARLGTDLLSQSGSITVKYKTESASEYTIARVISDVANNVVTNIDIIDLLEENSTINIQLTASIQPEDTPITRNITYTVHRVPMSIEAYNYNPATLKTSNFNFQYYCIGNNLAKIVHFVIDGVDTTEDIGTPANTDLLTKQISVNGLARGMHSLKVYFTVGSFHSNEINTYFLYDNNTENNKPLIALATNKSAIQDGDNLNLYYTVYTKGLQKTESITLETYTIIDNVCTVYETKSYANIDNGIEHTIAITNYPSSGTFYMTMQATHTVDNVAYTDSKTISITITEYQSAYDAQMIRAGGANMIYEYTAAGRTNNDSDKNAYHHTFTSVSGTDQVFTATNTGFNWASNGYTNGESLIISGGATHSIDVPLFTSNTGSVSLETDASNDDILKNGRTFEIDYEVNSATDLNAEIASFGSGLKITPSVSYLVPQGTTVTVNSHGLIEKEDEICAAYLAMGKRMHMVFVIEPKSTTPTSQGEYHQCVNIYINGEFVNSCPYALSDSFSTNSTFTMGSNTCIIKLYSVHMYNRGLTNDEVLRNFMMAPTTKTAKINRFAANDVLDANKLVDYNKARNKFNCLLITGEISPYKKETKTPSGVTLTKPDFENLSYTTEFNLLDKNANDTYYSSNNVQGTSSQTYPIHNLKVYLAEEEITTDPNTGDEVAASKKYKYSLKGPSGIAESTLCWKADYMSTDHANTLNANFANDLFTDKLPSQVADPKVQNTVYGIRCLLFQRNDEQSPPVFIADGCLNNDKGNNSAFGLSIKNESISDTTRQKWEFTNNSSALDFFQADGLLAISNDDYYAKTAFESTFPDEGDLEDEGLEPNYNHLQVLMTWVHQRANYWDASTNTGTGGTYNGTSYSTERELKKAIFINEFQQHFNLNHILTYHLFSEFIALCDNRAKNMFLRCDNVRTEEVLDTSENVIFSGNSNPNASFFSTTTNIGTQDDPIYAFTHADQIDWENSTFAIWYPVLYDLDSCYGVENVGRITIPYDADWTYTYNGKNQFSGVESRLWLMVEDSFGAELKTLAQTLYPNKLNYNVFYTTQIDAMLNSVCPAITNQDMLLKFNAYWADGFIDYSLPNNPHVYRDYKYIQRGSRSYQKDTFIKLRSNYLSSKYVTSNFMNDQIRFRSSVVVPVSNSGITVTTNQTLYPAITYGDNKEAIRSVNKVNPGDSVTLYASDQVGNTDTIHIGGASALTDIGDISKFEPYNLDVSGGVNLKSLIVGSNNVNASTNKIDGLGSCALLETINVRNCTNFSGTLNLSGNGLIKNVYAAGSGISNIELHEGGNLTNIEYGAATTTIKIINHGGLQSFVYEDAQNNNYANVNRLHIENTPNVPIVDIVNKAISHLTAGIRLVGINVNLGDNPTFLNTIVSDLAKGKYLNSAGVFITDSTRYPYISGTVYITSIRASLLDKLHAIYGSDLVIVASEIVNEYEVKYENYDGTLLFTDYGTNEDNLKDPVYDTNPITNTSYITIPTKPEDVQYKYKFGTYDGQNRYRKFSGWVRKGTTTNPTIGSKINGSFTLVAVYPTTELQEYRVSWYEDASSPTAIYYMDVDYGDDLSSELSPIELGTLQRVKSTGNGIKVFSGWSRPLGKITGNVNVYAQWQTSTINNETQSITMSELTAADLYALSLTENATKKRLLQENLGQMVYIPMGQDFNYTDGVTTTNLLAGNTPVQLEGIANDAMVYNNITPLATNSDWTFAIDYKFLMNSGKLNFSGNEYVLASCYQNANSSIVGFKIYMTKDTSSTAHHPIRVSWGNSNVIIDYACSDETLDDKIFFNSYRNVVVLSHNADQPNTLRVSYIAPNLENSRANSGDDVNKNSYGSNYGLSPSNALLTWENNTPINTPLIIGGNYNGATTTIETDDNFRKPAEAMVYWAKFWDTDLGESSCSKLAAWPHETVPFYLSGYNGSSDARATEQIYTGTNLSFVAAQGMGDRYFYPENSTENYDSNGYFGWHQSVIRSLCNDIIYEGVPEVYRSIINQTQVTSIIKNPEITETPYPAKYTNDYLFLPAKREVINVGTDNQTNEVNSQWISPWSWMVTAGKTNVLGFVSGSNTIVETKTATLNAYLYRFLGHPVTDNCKIFMTSRVEGNTRVAVDPSTINNLKYRKDGNQENITVQTGDIWVHPSASDDYGYAYMYFTNEDIARGIKVNIVTTNGGWKLADYWNLRSLSLVSGGAYENSLMRVDHSGTLNQQFTATTMRERGRLVCPEFTI